MRTIRIFLLLLWPLPCGIAAQTVRSSTHYTLRVESVDEGGGRAVAPRYTLHQSLGGGVASSGAASLAYVNRSGYGATMLAGLEPAVVSPLTANGTFGLPLSPYQVLASPAALVFEASGLPSGLALDGATGLITGTPAQAGTFPVALGATNFAGTGTAVLTLEIARAPQAITFDPIPDQVFGAPPVTVGPIATSDLPVAVFVVSGPATVTGTTVALTGAGAVVLAASQPGDDNYLPAPEVQRSFTVAPAPATVALSNLLQTYSGGPRPAGVATAPAGLPVAVTYNGSSTLPVNAGVYAVVATISDPDYVGTASASLQVLPAAQTITFEALPPKVVSDPPFTLTASSTSGLPVTFSSDAPTVASVGGNVVTLVGPGTAVVTASQAGDGNVLPAPAVGRTLVVTTATPPARVPSLPILGYLVLAGALGLAGIHRLLRPHPASSLRRLSS